MTPSQFYEMRPGHFFLKLTRHNENRENKHRLDCEITRLQTTELVNIHLKKNDRLKPNQLWKFPWDKESEIEEQLNSMTPEEIEKATLEFLRIENE